MVVSTKSPCPYCQKESKTNLLQYDVGQGRTYCVEGHVITDPTEIENPKAAPAPAAASPEPPPAAPASPQLKLEPVPDAIPGLKAEVAPAPVQEAPMPAPVASPAPTPKGISPLDHLAKTGYVEMPGGDVLMQIRISERFVGPLKEAAVRYFPPTPEERDTFQKHMQNVIDRAIDLGWAW